MARLVVTLKANRETTRLLVTLGETDVLRAVLPSPTLAHPKAAETLLEAVAMWFQRPLYAVLYADAEGYSSALNLCDGFGIGRQTALFEVEVYDPARRLRALGSFADLHQLALRGVP
jgi:hypothetical protein